MTVSQRHLTFNAGQSGRLSRIIVAEGVTGSGTRGICLRLQSDAGSIRIAKAATQGPGCHCTNKRENARSDGAGYL